MKYSALFLIVIVGCEHNRRGPADESSAPANPAANRASEPGEARANQPGAARVSEPGANRANQPDKRAAPFASELLGIASEYRSWPKVDQQSRWAPIPCAAARPRRDPRTGHLSTSEDEDTHGQKLYFLYARDRDAYVDLARTPQSPVGQVVVKDAWHAATADSSAASDPDAPRARRGGTMYRGTSRAGIFIMAKQAVDTAGTDRGWVYGVVSPDGREVVESGVIASCQACHQQAKSDRLFGLP